jgi:hypothetical protein
MPVITLAIQKIRLDFQPPENLCEENVSYHLGKFRRREKIEPLVVYFDGVHYYLFDGFHRVAAPVKVGRKRLLAEVKRGNLADMEIQWRARMAGFFKELAAASAKVRAKKRQCEGG